MEMYRKCTNCNVDVSSDLANCPLCGKYVLDERKNETVEENKYSYPIYSMKEIHRAKWVNIIRIIFWLLGGISLLVNLIFKTKPYFFPYVITALFMIMTVFIAPFGRKQSYVKNITKSSMIISLFLVFIDVYDYYTVGTAFGWALSYSAPLFLSAAVIAATIVCFVSRRYEIEMIKSVGGLMIYAIIYFIVVMFGFPDLKLWPSLVFLLVSVGWFLILQAIKRNRFWKEIKKNFHI